MQNLHKMQTKCILIQYDITNPLTACVYLYYYRWYMMHKKVIIYVHTMSKNKL